MGSIASKSFKEMMDEDFQGFSTPPSGKRRLATDFDPRSPTCGIDRTPIQIEKTPDTSMIDPRSPSIGIVRTPMASGKSTDAQVFDPRSPTVGIDRTPIYSKTQDELDLIVDVTEDLAAYAMSDSFANLKVNNSSKTAELRNTVGKLELEESIELMVKESSGSEYEDDAQLIKTPDSSSSKKAQKIKKTPTKEASCQKKAKAALFQGHTNTDASPTGKPSRDGSQRSPLRLIADSQRSPLGRKIKDVNSPRAIVQRKQVHKLDMIKSQCSVQVNKSPSKYRVFHDDKENSTPEL